MAGRLILCATPIGNLEDASRRLAATLESVDVIYAEDTRRSRVLLESLSVKARLRSYFAGNEQARAGELQQRLEEGKAVALLTDAGTPAISDPGLSAVRAAVAAGAAVSVVPGPSAVTAALAVSGFGADRFVFEGFLPRKGSARRERVQAIAAEERTVVLFASARRLLSDLEDLASEAGSDRRVVVTRELTKLHEEVWRGTLGEAVAWAQSGTKGEITLVVEGAPRAEDLSGAVAEVHGLMETGESFSAAVRQVAELYGIGRGRLYKAARPSP